MLKVDEVEDIEGQGGDESALVKAECEPVGLSEVTDGTQDVSPTEGLSTGHTYYFYQCEWVVFGWVMLFILSVFVYVHYIYIFLIFWWMYNMFIYIF
jgi:hypothetical protein